MTLRELLSPRDLLSTNLSNCQTQSSLHLSSITHQQKHDVFDPRALTSPEVTLLVDPLTLQIWREEARGDAVLPVAKSTGKKRGLITYTRGYRVREN
jgi:hypothetical protein